MSIHRRIEDVVILFVPAHLNRKPHHGCTTTQLDSVNDHNGRTVTLTLARKKRSVPFQRIRGAICGRDQDPFGFPRSCAQ